MSEFAEQAVTASSARIRGIVEAVLGVEVLDLHANIIGLGANSMEIVRIINRIEDETGKRLRFENVGFDPSIAKLALELERTEVSPPSEPVRAGPSVASVGRDRDGETPPGAAIRINAGWPVAGRIAPNAVAPGGSVRRFKQAAIDVACLGELLGALYLPEPGSGRRAAYGSAGSYYPVQIYLYVKAGGVSGLPCGIYYYQPRAGELWSLAPDLVIDTSHYAPLQNAAHFEQAAFAIHLVSQPQAIERAYGARARDYCLLEAGAMAQVMRARAPEAGIGLCAIGDFAFETVRDWFELDPWQECLHTLIGGAMP